MTKILPWRKSMLIGAVVLLLLLLLLLLAMAMAPMASAGWNSYKTITINGSKVQGTVSNFPVLISLTDTDLRDDAQNDGDDILFTNNLNTLKLDHEIEEFDTSTGKLVAWVQIPSLSTSGYTMWMWYNNSECGPQENPEGVWDGNYVMVQHLEELEDYPPSDSTSYDNNGSVYDDAYVDQNATGKIDGADDFDGRENSYVEVDDNDSLDITGSFTLEAWIKVTEFPQNNNVDDVICKGYQSYGMGIRTDSESESDYEIVMEVVHDTRHKTDDDGTGVTLTTGTWYYIVAVFNDSANKAYLYLNGAEELNATENSAPSANIKFLEIGTCSESRNNKNFDGIIDEVRISTAARSADWIVTCYNNQNNPGTGEGGFLLDIGLEVTPVSEQPVPELSPIFLFSVGLLALAGYLYVRTHS